MLSFQRIRTQIESTEQELRWFEKWARATAHRLVDSWFDGSDEQRAATEDTSRDECEFSCDYEWQSAYTWQEGSRDSIADDSVS